MAAKPPELLDRDTFRSAVFARDNHRCVIRGNGRHNGYRIDAHHIMERRLFTDPHQFGGYFLDNGATLPAGSSSDRCHPPSNRDPSLYTGYDISDDWGGCRMHRVALRNH
jgi:hypothetical protein